MPLNLPKFDPSRQFVAATSFLYSGHAYTKGEPFPEIGANVPPRKLEQLYSIRKITYDDEITVRQLPYRGPAERAAKERVRENNPDKTLGDEVEIAAVQLRDKHTGAQLFDMAKGLAGASKSMSKIELARMLVKAGRAGDGVS